MPVDFQSYILSSSPPGFEMESFWRENFTKPNGYYFESQGIRPVMPTKVVTLPTSIQEPLGSVLGNVERECPMNAVNAERVLSWEKSYDDVVKAEHTESIAYESSNCLHKTKSEAKMGIKKSVSFADDVGLALEDVRYMKEPSDVPPTFQPDLLARLNLDSQSFSVEPVSYVLNFPQPLSDYLALRNKVESNSVSLESATVKGTRAVGTVRVKNTAFEKKVFVRITFDDWVSCDDVTATFLPTSGNSLSSFYDTFTFEINFPSGALEAKKIVFAICYQTGSEEFWDNNNGENYEIISADAGNSSPVISTDKVVFSLNHEDSWANYSGWDGIDSHDPYW